MQRKQSEEAEVRCPEAGKPSIDLNDFSRLKAISDYNVIYFILSF
jgi:hypothetical protein